MNQRCELEGKNGLGIEKRMKVGRYTLGTQL